MAMPMRNRATSSSLSPPMVIGNRATSSSLSPPMVMRTRGSASLSPTMVIDTPNEQTNANGPVTFRMQPDPSQNAPPEVIMLDDETAKHDDEEPHSDGEGDAMVIDEPAEKEQSAECSPDPDPKEKVKLALYARIVTFTAQECEKGNVDMKDLLKLRLVSCAFDEAVLFSLIKTGFFELKNDNDAISLHKQQQPLSSSYLEFVTSFISLEPFPQRPWYSSLSSVLNHVVHEIMYYDGFSPNPEMRILMLRKLCRHVAEMHHWRQDTEWFNWALTTHSNPDFIEWASETQSLEFDILLARIILGVHHIKLSDRKIQDMLYQRSHTFGTLLEAAIKGGVHRRELVRTILAYVNVNDTPHATLETAIEVEGTKMLELLFQHGLLKEGPRMEKAIQTAVAHDRVEAALFLIQECTKISKQSLRSCAAKVFWTACEHNHLKITKALLMDPETRVVDVESQKCLTSPSPLQRVIFFGHKKMLEFLLDHSLGWTDEATGKEYYDIPLAAVACSGDLSMLTFLHYNNVRVDNVTTWIKMLETATHHGTPRHMELVTALVSYDGSLALNPGVSLSQLFQQAIRRAIYSELFINACVYGNLTVVEKLVENGANPNMLEGQVMTPVLAAKAAGQKAVVDLLLKLGADDIDPLQTVLRDQFEKGELPRTWKRREPDVGTCWKWSKYFGSCFDLDNPAKYVFGRREDSEFETPQERKARLEMEYVLW